MILHQGSTPDEVTPSKSPAKSPAESHENIDILAAINASLQRLSSDSNTDKPNNGKQLCQLLLQETKLRAMAGYGSSEPAGGSDRIEKEGENSCEQDKKKEEVVSPIKDLEDEPKLFFGEKPLEFLAPENLE